MKGGVLESHVALLGADSVLGMVAVRRSSSWSPFSDGPMGWRVIYDSFTTLGIPTY